MNAKERKLKINKAGKNLAGELPGFYGSVKLNIQNGKYVNANIEESIVPDGKVK